MKKKIVIVMAIVAILLSCNIASAADVAIYVWSGANSENMLALFRAVEATGHTPYGIGKFDITNTQDPGGRLSDFDVLILPAGEEGALFQSYLNLDHLCPLNLSFDDDFRDQPYWYNKNFTDSMKTAVQNFVSNGGGFVGIELGAYFATSDYPGGLGLLTGTYTPASIAPGIETFNISGSDGSGFGGGTVNVFMSNYAGGTFSGGTTVVTNSSDDPVAVSTTYGSGRVILTSLMLSLRADSEQDWTIWDNEVTNNTHADSEDAWMLIGRMINWTLTGTASAPTINSSNPNGEKIAVVSTHTQYGGAWPGLIPAVGKAIANAGHIPLAIRDENVRDATTLTTTNFAAAVFPGGNAYGYYWGYPEYGMHNFGVDNVRNFVNAGGGYLGICAGSYLGVDRIVWNGDTGTGTPDYWETTGSLRHYPMDLWDWDHSGYELSDTGPHNTIATFDDDTDSDGCGDVFMWAPTDTTVDDLVLGFNSDPQKHFYYGGGSKTISPLASVEEVAQYDDLAGTPANAVRFERGNGRVLLVGTHPEARSDDSDWLYWNNYEYDTSTQYTPNEYRGWDFIDAAFNNWLIPKTVVLLFDTSGSMSWGYTGDKNTPTVQQRLTLAKEAVYPFMVQLLALSPPDNDIVKFGIARFPKYPYDPDTNCKAESITDSTDIIPVTSANIFDAIGAEPDRSGSTIADLTANGITPMVAGLETAAGMFGGGGVQAIVLLSDGYHNCPSQIEPDTAPYNDLIDSLEGIRVFTIGFSKPGDTDGHFLDELATTTGGHFEDVTEDPGFNPGAWDPATALSSSYNKILADGLGLDVVADPMGMIVAGESTAYKAAINEHDRQVSFLLSWVTPQQGRLGLTLKSSDNQPITTIRNPGVRAREGKTYQIITVDRAFLQQADKVGPEPWTIEITGNDTIPDGEPEHYQYSIIADSKLIMAAVLDQLRYKTGEVVTITARIKEQGTLLTNLETAQVQITRPTDGSGNWFAANKVTEKELAEIPANLSNENLPKIQRKAKFLTDIRKVAYPGRSGPVTLSLYDDGTHGDANSGDGIFTNQFSDTLKDGTYSFYVRVSGSTGAGNKFEREQMIQKYITANATPEFLLVDVVSLDISEDKVHRYAITATPKDALGNHLGPGYSGSISMSTSRGTFVGGVEDNLDGSYTQNLNLPVGVDEKDVDITVGVRGENLTFTLAEKMGRRYGISFHLGRAVPRGDFDDDYDPGYNVGVNAEYRLSPRFFLQGLIGYSHFDAGSSSVSDTYWWNISANLKYEIMTTPLKPYILGGAGIYIPKNGSAKPGFNIGLGLDYSWTPDWTVELGVDYNHIFTSSSDTQFVVPQVGVIYRFW